MIVLNHMKKTLLIITVIFLSNLPSMYYGWYLNYWWFDTAQHFLGGFFIAMLFSYYLKDHLLPARKLGNTLIVVGATVFIGVVWEFTEYIANQTLIEPFYRWFEVRAYFIGDLQDTINDLLLDILGGFTLMSLYFFRHRSKNS